MLPWHHPIMHAQVFLHRIVGGASQLLSAWNKTSMSMVDRPFQSSTGRRASGMRCMQASYSALLHVKWSVIKGNESLLFGSHHWFRSHSFGIHCSLPHRCSALFNLWWIRRRIPPVQRQDHSAVALLDQSSMSRSSSAADTSPVLIRRVRFESPSSNQTRSITTSLHQCINIEGLASTHTSSPILRAAWSNVADLVDTSSPKVSLNSNMDIPLIVTRLLSGEASNALIIRRPPMSHMNLKVLFIILIQPIIDLTSWYTALILLFTNYLGHYRP